MNPILPDDLAVFLQTVQCGSFSAAARALNVAPKVASKQVARLEAALGVALFTRNTRNLRLRVRRYATRRAAYWTDWRRCASWRRAQTGCAA